MTVDYRKSLEAMRAQILSQQPNRADPVRDGNEMADEDVQPLTEMSQSIASARNAKMRCCFSKLKQHLKNWTKIQTSLVAVKNAMR